METQESGIDLAFDVSELIDMEESQLITNVGTIKSKPIIGSPQKEVKHAATPMRVNLKMQLQRQRLEEERQRDSQRQHQLQQQQQQQQQNAMGSQTKAIQMPAGGTFIEPPVQVKLRTGLTNPTQYHLEARSRLVHEQQYVRVGKTSAPAAAATAPTSTSTPRSLSTSSVIMGLHHGGGGGSAPVMGGEPQSPMGHSSAATSVADSDLLEDLQSVICEFGTLEQADPSQDTDLLDLDTFQLSTTVKAESGLTNGGKNSSNFQRSRMSEEEKSQRHKAVERKRRSKEDNAIDRFRIIVAPRSSDSDDITARKLSRGDVLQMAVQKLEQVIKEQEIERRRQKATIEMSKKMLQAMQNMEMMLKSKGLNVPPEMGSSRFFSQLFDLCKDNSSGGMGDLAANNNNLEPQPTIIVRAPEKRKRVVAVVKASRSRSTPKARTPSADTSSLRSRSSIESQLSSSAVSRSSADSLFSKVDMMELEDSPSPLSGDPLLSTASHFALDSCPSPTKSMDSFISSPLSVNSDNSYNSADRSPPPQTPRSNRTTSHKFPNTSSSNHNRMVLEENSEIPENEMAKFGYAPSLIVKQQQVKTPSSKSFFLPSISVNEVEALFRL